MDNATYLDFERNLKKFFSKIGSDLPKFREYVLNLIIKNGFTHEGISNIAENHIRNKLKSIEPNQALDAMSELMDGIIDTGTRISFPDILDSNPYDLALVIENLQSDYDWKKMDELVRKIAVNLGNEEGWALRTAIPESTAFRWEITFGEKFADFHDGLVEEGVIQKGEFLDFDFDTRKELYQDWLKEAKENIRHYIDGTKPVEEIETTSPYYHWLAAGDNELGFIGVNNVIKEKLGDTKSTFTYSDAHKLYLKNKLGIELGESFSIRKEIVQQIVNNPNNLGDAVRIKLFDTLTDVPELNLSIFEPGKRFVNPANGINQLLEKLNLDEKPRDVISLEMFDVNDFYVVPPDKLQEAVNLVKNDPRYALDINAMHKDYLEMLENAIVETGFIGDTDTRGGLYADLDVVLEDWLSEGGDLEGNKFFNNSPTWDNLPDTQNVRGLIASAGGPGNIRKDYVMPQYFKDQENVPYKAPDTPTNVVDDINKLNQELNTKYADVIDNDYGLNFELRDGRLHITDMYLKDTERGKGIGSQIFDEIKQFADNNNLEISLYNDGDFNTTFWENKGFEEWNYKNNVDFANTPDDKLGLFILDADTPTQSKVIETAEDLQEYIDPQAVNKVEEFASKFPDKFKQIVKVAGEIPKKALTAAQLLDPGDIVITQGLRTLLPRLGAAAIAPAALTAYVAYELSVLAVDAANALEKAAEKQGLAQFGDNTDVDWKQLGKDTWSEFGDVSDTWSLSWKISEPMINWAFDKISSYNGEQ